MKREQKAKATNEFNQVVMGNSLSKDAWRRLRKNKMAVISVVIVAIYMLLAITAPILPIYSYDEIVNEHQNLLPSLTKTSGELMWDKKLSDLYTQAWRQNRLTVTDAENEILEAWVLKGQATKVWDYLLEEGNRQLAEGSFEWSAAEKRTLDNLEKKIASDIQITIQKVWQTNQETGKKINISKMAVKDLVQLYADLLGVPTEPIVTQYTYEITESVSKEIQAEVTDLSKEEYALMAEQRLSDMSGKDYDKLIKANIIAKINSTVKDMALYELKSDASQASTTYPFDKEMSITDTVSASIKAAKMHDRRYYLGTDRLGRDLMSRIIYGSQVSIAIGLIGTFTSVLIGVILGSLAGYIGGKVDYFIMRVVDIMYGLPYMLLVIIAMAIFGRNILNLFFALAIISWLTISRMVRGQIMSLKNQEFIEAARSMGASTGRIIFKHLVPNSLSVIIVFSTLRIPSFIMTESFLSFLGLGVQAPFASWGSLVGDAVGGMTLYPWRLFFPAIVMTIFLFAMNFLGDGLRDAFDPQSKNKL